ncbi:vanadium-dependent haloperoxidase [Candidatus Babeliales bacterium]|nr:vanadium-dependent haloperoxidase [Candidatus Babeliales bacterium]
MNKKIILLLSVLCSYGLAQADDFTLVRRANRRFNAATVRDEATDRCVRQDLWEQPTNGDEELYDDYRGNYSKGLAQLASGLPDPKAYESLLFALATGKPSDFDKIMMGTNPVQRKLHSPQAGFDFNLGGADSWIHSIAAPPALASAEKAGELIELYQMALLRDQRFNEDFAGPTAEVTAALTALNALSDFRGPKAGGMVTAQTLFRSNVPGAVDGPYISQFLLLPVSFSDTTFTQTYRVPKAVGNVNINLNNKDNNFLTDIATWTNIQKGQNPTNAIDFETGLYRHIITLRDLASFVHNDPPQLPYIFALLILAGWAGTDATVFNPNNPYAGNPTQTQFAEFFVPQFIGLLSLACDMALRAAWYQKWVVHRTIRPEYMAWLAHQQYNGVAGFTNLHNDLFAPSTTLDDINTLNMTTGGDDTYLLPQVFPEGCPLHPTYPAGHATIGGAAATILKAFFNGDHDVPNPVVANAAGTALAPYGGPALKIGNELNKLAANIAIGRNMAGVHYRSDGEESLRLGEAVALSLLEDFAYTMNIDFEGFKLKKFDGTEVTVGAKKVMPGLPR